MMRRASLWGLVIVAVCDPAHALAQTANRFTPVAPLVRSHQDAAALHWLNAQDFRDEPDARYLRGRLLERLGRAAAAADAFDLQDGLPEPILRGLPLRRGIALARSGQCSRAVELLGESGFDEEGRPRAGPAAATARAVHAECAGSAASPEEGIRQLERVIREDARDVDTAAARLSLASLLRRVGQTDRALEELRSLLTHRPEHPAAPAAAAALAALGSPFRPTAEQRLERASRFRSLRMPQHALEELDGARVPSGALRDQWLHERGMALFQTRRRYPEAARVLRRISSRASTVEEDAFHAARALSRAGQNRASIRAFRSFERRYRRHRRAGEAAYLAAWLELREGRAQAMKRLERSRYVRNSPRIARNVAWHLAFEAFERGRYQTAAEAFEDYAKLRSGPLVEGRGTYWSGRAHMLARNRRKAARAFERVIASAPLHWYALLAKDRLEQLGRTIPAPVAAAPASTSGAQVPDPLPPPPHVAFLHHLGLSDEAARALRSVEAEIRAAAPKPWGLRNLVAAYGSIGHATRVYRLVASDSRALLTAPTPSTRWQWNAAYPRAYEAAVVRAATEESLEPEYLWAIMRQESGYNPDAVSYADAIGLLQLLPRTARRIAEQLGLPFERRKLFEPEFNARIAAHYNAQLRQQFGVPLSIAAYNAGEHRVAQWLEREARSEPISLDRFVERIPIDQTRNYIRRVTSHLAHYLYLRDGANEWPDLSLPREVRYDERLHGESASED